MHQRRLRLHSPATFIARFPRTLLLAQPLPRTGGEGDCGRHTARPAQGVPAARSATVIGPAGSWVSS
eukprot:5323-Pleurochrysis_carterae.AAC.2